MDRLLERQFICPDCSGTVLAVKLYDSKDKDRNTALLGIRCMDCGFTRNFFYWDFLDETENCPSDR